MFSTVIEKDKFLNTAISSTRNIQEILYDNSYLLVGKDIFLKDKVQKYILNAPVNNLDNAVLKPLILESVIRAENLAGGAGNICLDIIANFLDEYTKKIKSGISIREIEEDLNSRLDDIKHDISKNSKKLKKSDFYMILNHQFSTKVQRNLIETISEKSDVFSPVSIEKTNRNNTRIHFSNGFKFNIEIDRQFLLHKRAWSRKNVKCMVIDGFIESIGEIHHLLEKASSTNKPHVVFVRHMSDEVRSTILLNLKRGTLDIFPIEVGFDENTLNILNDISICCNSDLISSHKGDTISAACRKDLTTIDKIVITESEIRIINRCDESSLSAQLNYILEKMKKEKSPEVVDLLKKRVDSLSSEEVKIFIGNDILIEDRQVIEKLDKFFRTIRSFINYGYIKSHDIRSEEFRKMLCDTYYPSASIFFAARSAFSTIRSIVSIEKAIIIK